MVRQATQPVLMNKPELETLSVRPVSRHQEDLSSKCVTYCSYSISTRFALIQPHAN